MIKKEKLFKCLDTYLLSFNDFKDESCFLIHTDICNLDCKYCFNKKLLKKYKKVCFIDKILPKLLDEVKEYNLNKNITISGGEPTLNIYIIDIIKYLYDKGWNINLYTNGTNPYIIKLLLPYIKYISIDIKLPLFSNINDNRYFNLSYMTDMIFGYFSEKLYISYTETFKHLLEVLDNIDNENIEFRTTFNDYLLSASLLSKEISLLHFLKSIDSFIYSFISNKDIKIDYYIQKVISTDNTDNKYTTFSLDLNDLFYNYINKINYKILNIKLR